MLKMKISIILPVYSETESLIATVEEIRRAVATEYIQEIIIMASPQSSEESLTTCRRLSQRYPWIRYFLQKNNPGVGWAYREAFDKVTGNYVLIMNSDGETAPQAIPLMIKTAKTTQCDIVLANRWSSQGGFENYNFIKKQLNFVFQQIMKILFVPTIDDYTYGFRLYRVEALTGIHWEEGGHPFFLEALLKPLVKGFTRIEQVPVKWSARATGISRNTFFRNFLYFRTATKIYLKK